MHIFMLRTIFVFITEEASKVSILESFFLMDSFIPNPLIQDF